MRKLTPVSSLSDKSDPESSDVLPIANPSSVPIPLLTKQEKRRRRRRKNVKSSKTSGGSAALLALLLVIAIFVILEVIVLDRFFLGPGAKLVDVQIEEADVFVQAVGEKALGVLPNLFSKQTNALEAAKKKEGQGQLSKLRQNAALDAGASKFGGLVKGGHRR